MIEVGRPPRALILFQALNHQVAAATLRMVQASAFNADTHQKYADLCRIYVVAVFLVLLIACATAVYKWGDFHQWLQRRAWRKFCIFVLPFLLFTALPFMADAKTPSAIWNGRSDVVIALFAPLTVAAFVFSQAVQFFHNDTSDGEVKRLVGEVTFAETEQSVAAGTADAFLRVVAQKAARLKKSIKGMRPGGKITLDQLRKCLNPESQILAILQMTHDTIAKAMDPDVRLSVALYEREGDYMMPTIAWDGLWASGRLRERCERQKQHFRLKLDADAAPAIEVAASRDGQNKSYFSNSRKSLGAADNLWVLPEIGEGQQTAVTCFPLLEPGDSTENVRYVLTVAVSAPAKLNLSLELGDAIPYVINHAKARLLYELSMRTILSE